MNSHPVIEQAALVLAKAQTKWCALGGLTPEQVRNCIIVEMTPNGMTDLMINMSSHMLASIRQKYGPVLIMGIRFYQVDNLPDGDDWRVLNALGTN